MMVMIGMMGYDSVPPPCHSERTTSFRAEHHVIPSAPCHSERSEESPPLDAGLRHARHSPSFRRGLGGGPGGV